MPDDKESAEQETVEEVIETNDVAEDSDDGPMTDEQLQSLFSSIDKPAKKEPKAKEEETAEVDEDDESAEVDEPEEEDSEESDADKETSEDDDDAEVSAADKLKELAAQAKEQKAEAAAEVDRAEKATAAEESARKAATDSLAGKDVLEYNGKQIDLAEFREEYGDIAEVMEAMAIQTAATMVKQQLADGGYVSKEEFDELRADAAQERFISELSRRHPKLDIRNIADNADFWSWKEKQDADTQAFFEDQTVHGMSAVLAAYEESLVKDKNTAVDEAAKEKKAKHVALHSSSTRTKKPAARKAVETDTGGTLDGKGQAKLFKDIKIED